MAQLHRTFRSTLYAAAPSTLPLPLVFLPNAAQMVDGLCLFFFFPFFFFCFYFNGLINFKIMFLSLYFDYAWV